MMVERSPRVELFQELEKATKTLSELSEKKQHLSQNEVKELSRFIKNFNTTGKEVLASKTITPAEKNTIQKTLTALQIFQTAPSVARKEVDQMIVSLLSDIKLFDQNLKNLSKGRVGDKVEKSDKSKEY